MRIAFNIIPLVFLFLGGCSQGISQTLPKKGNYNPETIQVVQGKVLEVELVPMTSGRGQGVHVLLQTEQETIPVHLGPDWFLSSQNLTIQKGDQLEVTGSRVNFNGKDAIIASKVSKAGKTVVLRNQNGVPVWSGSKRRSS